MEFEKLIRERTSTRSFKDVMVEDELINKILEAGNVAPTAKNRQPQKIYVVKSKEGIEMLDRVTPCRYNAPLCLIVTSNKKDAYTKEDYSTYEMDATICATHMMLEATNLSVDNIWIKMFDKELLKKELKLDEIEEPIMLLMLGYKTDDYAGNPLHNVRKDLKDIVKVI